MDLDLPPLRSSLKHRSLSPLPRPTSPYLYDDVTQRVRQGALITRFNDMFAQDRLEAMDTLRKFSDDYENNQRILFTAMQVRARARCDVIMARACLSFSVMQANVTSLLMPLLTNAMQASATSLRMLLRITAILTSVTS